MQITNFIGIDVSKDTLDFSIVVDGKNLQHYKIRNNSKEIKSTITKILKAFSATIDDTIFCMEHTGLYNLPLVKWLQSQQAKIWLESGVHIRKTLGLIRGKNDKVDSERIAMYAFTNQHQMKLWKAPRKVIEKIAALLSQRARFIKAKQQLYTANKEQKQFLDKEIMKSLNKYTSKTLVVIDKQIEAIEKQILELMKEDEKLNRLSWFQISIATVINFITVSERS